MEWMRIIADILYGYESYYSIKGYNVKVDRG